jgi:Na+:H+ antiporter, NhaA family
VCTGVPGRLVGNFIGPTDVETSMGEHASSGGPPRSALFGHGSWSEAVRIGDVLRRETVGGALLLAATVLAMVCANSPWADAYTAIRDARLGPASLGLDLTVGQWAADGLLAIFFSSRAWSSSGSSWPEICGTRAGRRCRWRQQWVAWWYRRCCLC